VYAYAGLEAIKASYDRVEFGALRYMTPDGSLGCADSDLRMDYYHVFVYPTCLFSGGEIASAPNEGDADGANTSPSSWDSLTIRLRWRCASPITASRRRPNVTVEVTLTGRLERRCRLHPRLRPGGRHRFRGQDLQRRSLRFEQTPLTIDHAGETQVITLPFGYDASGGRVPGKWQLLDCRDGPAGR